MLTAAKELARRQGTSVGLIVSRLLRAALRGQAAPELTPLAPSPAVAGYCPFPAPAGQLVTNDAIGQLRDQARF